MDASGASPPGEVIACDGVTSRIDARATVAGFAISATSPFPHARCKAEPAREPLPSIAFTGQTLWENLEDSVGLASQFERYCYQSVHHERGVALMRRFAAKPFTVRRGRDLTFWPHVPWPKE